MTEQPNLKVSNEQENRDREPKKPIRNVVLYFLLFMCTGLVFLFIACSKYYIEIPEGFADELGKALGHTTLIGIVFYFLRRVSGKTGKRGMIFVYISIIFCIVAVYQSLGLFVKASNAKKAVNKIASIYNDVNAGKEIFNPGKKGTEQYGEITPLMDIMIEVGSAIQKDFSAMNYEIQECQFESIFKPETLTQPKLLSESMANYEKAITILDKYEKQILTRFDEYLIKIRNSSLPEDLKNRALSSVSKDKDQSIKPILGLFEIQKKFATEAKNLLIYINSRPNSFTYQNNRMICVKEEDANFCRATTEHLMSLLQEEEDLRKKIEQDASARLQKVNEIAK